MAQASGTQGNRSCLTAANNYFKQCLFFIGELLRAAKYTKEARGSLFFFFDHFPFSLFLYNESRAWRSPWWELMVRNLFGVLFFGLGLLWIIRFVPNV